MNDELNMANTDLVSKSKQNVLTFDDSSFNKVHIVEGIEYHKVSDWFFTDTYFETVGSYLIISDFTGMIIGEEELRRDRGWYSYGWYAEINDYLGFLSVLESNKVKDDNGVYINSGLYITYSDSLGGYVSEFYDGNGSFSYTLDMGLLGVPHVVNPEGYSDEPIYYVQISDKQINLADFNGGTIKYQSFNGTVRYETITNYSIVDTRQILLGSEEPIFTGTSVYHDSGYVIPEGTYFVFKPRSGEYISEIRSKEVKFPRGFYVFTNGEWKYCKPYVYDNYTWYGYGSKIELEDKYLLTSDGLNLMTSNNLYLKGKKG